MYSDVVLLRFFFCFVFNVLTLSFTFSTWSINAGICKYIINNVENVFYSIFSNEKHIKSFFFFTSFPSKMLYHVIIYNTYQSWIFMNKKAIKKFLWQNIQSFSMEIAEKNNTSIDRERKKRENFIWNTGMEK